MPPRRRPPPPDPAPNQVVGSLSLLVNKLAQLAGRGMTAALAPLGILPRESGILAVITQFGPMSQQRIGELLVVDRTTMVLSIDHLEELGLVERAVHPTDRRIFLITLTDAGVAAMHKAKRRLEAFEEELLGPLADEERAAFRRALLLVLDGALHPDVHSPPPSR